MYITAMDVADYLRMWRYPRMVVWLCGVTAGVLGVRALCFGVQPIPGLAELHAGFVVTPAAGVYCGPAGILGVMVAAWLGDWLFGVAGPWTPWRMMGAGVAAAVAERLWRGGSGPDAWGTPGALRRFLWVGIPAGCGYAAWVAMGASMSGMYPFGYLFLVTVIPVLWFFLLFAPWVFHVLAHYWVPAFGSWRTVMGRSDSPPPPRRAAAIAMWAGSLAAGPVGIVMGAWAYDTPPLPIPLPGTRNGWWVWIPVGACIAAAAAGLLPRSSPTPPPAFRPGRLGRYSLPPIKRR